MNKLSRKQGFTIMELMIVVAIMAILATIAIPGYQRYVTKSRLEEGKSVLNQHYLWMQNMYNKYNGYYVNSTKTLITSLPGSSNPGTKYSFSVETGHDCDGEPKSGGPSANHFCLKASPQNGQENAAGGGKECGILMIDQAGKTYIHPTGGSKTRTTTNAGISCFG